MNPTKVLGVLGGGHMTVAKVAAWVEAADLVIAADSGMLRVLEAGFVPDVVIGDFDSVTPDLIEDRIEAIPDLNQDNTDCAKLLEYVRSKGHSSVTLICAEGDLTDHFIDTVHSAVRSDLHVLVGLERGVAHILKGPTRRTISTSPGQRVSLLPLENVEGASLSGVKWSFSKQEMSVRGFTSISNISTSHELDVSIETGSAYLFVEGDEPLWLGSKSLDA